MRTIGLGMLVGVILGSLVGYHAEGKEIFFFGWNSNFVVVCSIAGCLAGTVAGFVCYSFEKAALLDRLPFELLFIYIMFLPIIGFTQWLLGRYHEPPPWLAALAIAVFSLLFFAAIIRTFVPFKSLQTQMPVAVVVEGSIWAQAKLLQQPLEEVEKMVKPAFDSLANSIKSKCAKLIKATNVSPDAAVQTLAAKYLCSQEMIRRLLA